MILERARQIIEEVSSHVKNVIESNIALYYATQGELPPASMMPTLSEQADTTYFHADITGDTLKITIDSPPSRPSLSKMHDMPMYLTPTTSGYKIVMWELSGTLAWYLGIETDF